MTFSKKKMFLPQLNMTLSYVLWLRPFFLWLSHLWGWLSHFLWLGLYGLSIFLVEQHNFLWLCHQNKVREVVFIGALFLTFSYKVIIIGLVVQISQPIHQPWRVSPLSPLAPKSSYVQPFPTHVLPCLAFTSPRNVLHTTWNGSHHQSVRSGYGSGSKPHCCARWSSLHELSGETQPLQWWPPSVTIRFPSPSRAILHGTLKRATLACRRGGLALTLFLSLTQTLTLSLTRTQARACYPPPLWTDYYDIMGNTGNSL
jgi:hypothetical protein